MSQTITFLKSISSDTAYSAANTMLRVFEILDVNERRGDLGHFMYQVRKEADIWSKQFLPSTRAIGAALWDCADFVGYDLTAFESEDQLAYLNKLREDLNAFMISSK